MLTLDTFMFLSSLSFMLLPSISTLFLVQKQQNIETGGIGFGGGMATPIFTHIQHQPLSRHQVRSHICLINLYIE